MKRFYAACGPGDRKNRIIKIGVEARETRTPAPIRLALGYALQD
jgi:hypothetical protein